MNTSDKIQLENRIGSMSVFREALGFVPGVVRAQKLIPRLIDAQASLEGATRLREGHLSRLQKERILLTIAKDRSEPYGIAEHCKVLSSLGEPEARINACLINFTTAGLSTPELASLRFGCKLAGHARSVCDGDIELLRASGLTDEAIFETAVTAALAIYRGTLAAGLHIEPDFPMRHVLPREGQSQSNGDLAPPPNDHHVSHGKKGPYLPAPYLSPESFAPFAALHKTNGFIPNFFRSQSLRPDLLEAEIAAVEQIFLPDDILTRVQKESILLAVSAANLNSYCVAIHSNQLRGMGVSAEEGDQIAVDHHLAAIPDADKVLIDFAIKLGARFSEFTRDDLSNLRSVGFSEEQILECIAVTALNNFANFLQMGLGFEPDFEVPATFKQSTVKLSPPSHSPMHGDMSISTLAPAIVDPDVGLVEQAQAGDLQAFESLVRRHTQSVFRTLVAILGDSDEAQDAMQDVFLSAFKHIGSFEGRAKVSTWLASIARNAALQRIGRRKVTESLDVVECGEDGEFRPRQVRAWQDDPEQSCSKAQMRKLVEKGILQLSPTFRTIVMLRDIEQLSTDEVARRLGLSVPNVKTRLFRGRLMLREWLSPYFTKGHGGAAQ